MDHALTALGAEQCRKLYELIFELGNSLEVGQTLATLDAGLRRLVACDAAAVYLAEDGRLRAACTGGRDAGLVAGLEIAFGAGPSGLAAVTRRPVSNGDPAGEWAEGVRPAAPGLRTALAQPLARGEDLAGVVTLYRREPEAFSREEIGLVREIAGKASAALANALAHRKLERSATMDPESGLPNTRALFRQMDAELVRCRREGAGLAALVCRVAGLDSLGGGEKEKVLAALGSGFRDCCREYDCIARSGDEFVFLLGGLGPAGLGEKLKRLEALVDRAASLAAGTRPLALEAGAAFYPEDGADAEDLLVAAGRRMHAGQTAGGSQPS